MEGKSGRQEHLKLKAKELTKFGTDLLSMLRYLDRSDEKLVVTDGL